MAVAGLERFRPNAYRPPEFTRFWASTVTEAAQHAAAPEIEGRESPAPGLRLLDLRFLSVGDISIRAYLLCSERVQQRPLIVHAHGYNDRFSVRLDWAQRGFNVLGFDARGFGRSGSAIEKSPEGWVLTGIESPEKSIVRGAVADFLIASRVARELLSAQPLRVTYYGFSFGGALALMAGALSEDPDFLVLGQPTFGWTEERRRVAIAGSTREINEYIERYPWRREAVLQTLHYFDTMHFASLLESPVLIGIGLDDDVVPSRSVLAVANHVRSPIEVRLLPVSHSRDPRESLWREFDTEWLTYAGGSLPEDFGAESRQVRSLLGESITA